jgi:hypothetical protein
MTIHFEGQVRFSTKGPRNCRSLHGAPGQVGFAPPDFLWNLVALTDLMRLSLRERRTRDLVQCSVAGNPGRDDKGKGNGSIESACSTGAQRSGEICGVLSVNATTTSIMQLGSKLNQSWSLCGGHEAKAWRPEYRGIVRVLRSRGSEQKIGMIQSIEGLGTQLQL